MKTCKECNGKGNIGVDEGLGQYCARCEGSGIVDDMFDEREEIQGIISDLRWLETHKSHHNADDVVSTAKRAADMLESYLFISGPI